MSTQVLAYMVRVTDRFYTNALFFDYSKALDYAARHNGVVIKLGEITE